MHPIGAAHWPYFCTKSSSTGIDSARRTAVRHGGVHHAVTCVEGKPVVCIYISNLLHQPKGLDVALESPRMYYICNLTVKYSSCRVSFFMWIIET
jgi:hypothetical protein